MGSGVSGPVSVAEIPSTKRVLSSKFPSNFNVETFHKFRDVKLSHIDSSDHNNGDEGKQGREMLGLVEMKSSEFSEKQPSNGELDIVRPGIYTTVYSYYHWKNKYVDT